MRPLPLGAALIALLAGTASAETFKLGDLGPMPSRHACMSVAKQVLEAYVKEHGGHSTTGDVDDAESWSYSAWDLRPGDSDVVISCPVVASQVNAFFAIHSSGLENAADAETVAEWLRALWDRFF